MCACLCTASLEILLCFRKHRKIMSCFHVCVHCVNVYPHTVHGTHASQVTICSHNTDNVLYDLYISTFNQMCNFS